MSDVAALPLSRLLAALPDAYVCGPADIPITDISYDSRRVRQGALFVAVPSVDGGDGGVRFLPEAIQRGAAAVVAPPGVQVPTVTSVIVSDTRRALADVAASFYNDPSRLLRVYGVTGTDGKTTTTYLLEQILGASGRCTGLMGTVELKVGAHRERNLERMTTPESLDVQRVFREMVDAGVTDVPIEASSHALALDRLRATQFEAVALTNITGDHIEFHGSWEAYVAAKSSLFTDLAAGRPAWINAEDEHAAQLIALRPDARTYGLTHGDLRAVAVSPTRNGTDFTLLLGTERAPVRLLLPGRYNVANALAAAGLARHAGIPLGRIADALSRATAPPGRFQRVDAGQPFEILVDYAHTINAFRSLLSTVRERTAGRVIVVFGATGSRDRAKRPILARIARQYADLAFVTNEDPYGEDAAAIVEEILKGVPEDEIGARFRRELDRGEAIRAAVELARPGDTVVILGKGHEQSIVVGGKKEPWSDVAAVRRAIEAVI